MSISNYSNQTALGSLKMVEPDQLHRRHPKWIKAKLPAGPNYQHLKLLMKDLNLNTVCEEAQCPNIGECWNDRTATFMILGDVCTRRCMYCAVKKGKPGQVDTDEPYRLGQAVRDLELNHVVITSVNRDDLADGGASIFAECIKSCQKQRPFCTIEVLIPDLQGDWRALAKIVSAKPNVLNHNMETVSRLYKRCRPRSIYQRSLDLLVQAKKLAPDLLTKTGLMVGLGETFDELKKAIMDIRETQCDILTIGQYLPPSKKHLNLRRYYTPDEFNQLEEEAINLGFAHVEAGPMVRSSYHARKHIPPVS